MRAFWGLVVLCFLVGMLPSCASVEPVVKRRENSTESVRTRFSRAKVPSVGELAIGREWSCLPCLVRDKKCGSNPVKLVILQFDDIYAVSPRNTEERERHA